MCRRASSADKLPRAAPITGMMHDACLTGWLAGLSSWLTDWQVIGGSAGDSAGSVLLHQC
jgi:hypothetical protein